jgi:hypothetical protein
MIAGSRQNEGSKRFFFEKKNQKTFFDFRLVRFHLHGLLAKVFCFFLQKRSACFPHSTRPHAFDICQECRDHFAEEVERGLVGEFAVGIEFLAGVADENFRLAEELDAEDAEGLAERVLGAGGAQ